MFRLYLTPRALVLLGLVGVLGLGQTGGAPATGAVPSVPVLRLNGDLNVLYTAPVVPSVNAAGVVSASLKPLALLLGATVTVYGNVARVVAGRHSLTLRRDSSTALLDTHKLALPVKVRWSGHDPVVPVATLARALGYGATWDARTRMLTLSGPGGRPLKFLPARGLGGRAPSGRLARFGVSTKAGTKAAPGPWTTITVRLTATTARAVPAGQLTLQVTALSPRLRYSGGYDPGGLRSPVLPAGGSLTYETTVNDLPVLVLARVSGS